MFDNRLLGGKNMNQTEKHIRECAKHNSYIERCSKWFQGTYSPVSLFTILLFSLGVFLLLVRISRQLDAQSLELKHQPFVCFVDRISEKQYTQLKQQYNSDNGEHQVVVVIPAEADSNDINRQNCCKRKFYVFHFDSIP